MISASVVKELSEKTDKFILKGKTINTVKHLYLMSRLKRDKTKLELCKWVGLWETILDRTLILFNKISVDLILNSPNITAHVAKSWLSSFSVQSMWLPLKIFPYYKIFAMLSL